MWAFHFCTYNNHTLAKPPLAIMTHNVACSPKLIEHNVPHAKSGNAPQKGCSLSKRTWSNSCSIILSSCLRSSACESNGWPRNLWCLNASIGRSSGKTRTFKPRKDVPEGTKQYQLRKYAEATLVSHPWAELLSQRADYYDRRSWRIQGSGNLRLAVQLPEGEDLNEWLAVHGTSSQLASVKQKYYICTQRSTSSIIWICYMVLWLSSVHHKR